MGIFYGHGFHDIILSQSSFANSKHPHAIKEPFKTGESKHTRKEVLSKKTQPAEKQRSRSEKK